MRSVSPSSRRAWIEIAYFFGTDIKPKVALLAEGVDRNCDIMALRKRRSTSPSSRRAWIEIAMPGRKDMLCRSPSSRRAWIEIPTSRCARRCCVSPSSRRAWIEILLMDCVVLG